MYAVVHDTLYEIENNSWKKMCYMKSSGLNDIKVDLKKNIWLFYSSTIKYSSDNGASWNSITTPTEGFSGEIIGDFIYLKGYYKIYKRNFTLSTGGWQTVYDGGYNDFIVVSDSLLFISTGTLMKSTDGGLTWSNTKWSNTGVTSTLCEINYKNNKIFVGTYWNGAYYSDDGGETWVKSQGLPIGRGVSDVILFDNSIFVLVRDQKNTVGFYYSNDGGNIFSKVISGLDFWSEQFIDGFTSKGNNIYLSAGYRGFFKSSDNGQTWKEINNGINNIIPHHVIKIQTDSKGTIWTLLGTKGNSPNSPTWGVLKSNNDGNTWSGASGVGLADDYQTLEDLLVTPNGNAFASGYEAGTIFKTVDGGVTWLKNKLTNVYSTINILQSDSKNDTIFAGTFGDGIIRTINGGVNWVKIGNGIPENSFVIDIFVEMDTIYAIFSNLSSYYGIYKSIDLGKNWTKISSQNLKKIIKVGQELYGLYLNKVYKSNDDGISWSDYSENIPTVNCNLNSIICIENQINTNNNTLIVGSNLGIFISGTSNADWNKISSIDAKSVFWNNISKNILIGSTIGLNSSIINLETGLNNIENLINVYPNPSTDEVTFNLNGNQNLLNVFIYNNLGKLVISQKIENDNQINIKNLKKGCYIYRVFESDNIYSGKLIVN